MPITASDPDGNPLKFEVKVSNKKLQAEFAPNSNRSLLISVSGVDSNNNPFTGSMVAQLFEDLTPLTTARIIDLVDSNFYNGLLFQRVIKGFVAQCGGATTNLNLESGVPLNDDYQASLIYDGFGQLGMANRASATTSPSIHDSNDSQFFITDMDASMADANNQLPGLNFEQPIFGQLTSGLDVFAQIMSTPVGTNPDTGEISAPLSNVVMTSISVITNSQNTVLRLTAIGTNFLGKTVETNSLPPAAISNFLGTVTVTVSAANAAKQVATQTLVVNVVTDTGSYPPFWGPLPSSVTVSQSVATAFIVTVTNVDRTSTSASLHDAATQANPTNMIIDQTPHTSLLTFSPDATLTGIVHLVFTVTDNLHQPDIHDLAFHVLPRSPTPTMTIVPLNG